MLNERIIAVLKMEGYNTVEELLDIDLPEESTYNDKVIKFKGAEYLVLTEEEAEEKHLEYIENFIDDLGIEGFTPSFQEEILNNYIDDGGYFDDCLREHYESCVEDIKHEDGRLEEEMEDAECETEEEYIEHLIETAGDAKEYYKDNFDNEWFTKQVKENCSLDIEAISQAHIDADGIAHSLARYDGKEYEEDVDGETYYIYRTN